MASSRVSRDCLPRNAGPLLVLIVVAWLGLPNLIGLVHARSMLNDPEGFAGIAWGSSLTEVQGLALVHSWERFQEYQYQHTPPQLGDASVESLKLTAIEGRFARVTIRYQGENTHHQVMTYLQATFGAIERMPGSMVRGLNQQFTWRGAETEINLTYQGMGERGFVFIESRALAPLFLEGLPEHGY